ncbi:hypothetical protein PG988_007433 [Apiospora saccharicola]
MYGATKLPEDHYCFATAAGQVLVRALALADYRYAQNYVVDRLNQMITNYFKRMVTWKSIPKHPLRDDTYKLFLHDINDTYIAYMRTMTLPLMASRVLVLVGEKIPKPKGGYLFAGQGRISFCRAARPRPLRYRNSLVIAGSDRY